MLSVLVAMMASYTALSLAGRVTETQGRASTWWLAGGAVAMGCGIWSMHFIGMLAFSLPIRLSYDIAWTLASLVAAIAVSAFALRIVTRPTIRRLDILVGGVIMGAGICCMHYMGMQALQMNPGIDYDPAIVAVSVVIAVVASIVALWLAFTLRSEYGWRAQVKKGGAAVVMGLAVIAMHYTGMEAARFGLGSICMAKGGVNADWLAVLVAMAALSLLTITMLLSVVDSRLASRTASLVESLSVANNQLHHLALHDTLTRLPNRSLLEDRITHAITSSERSGKRFALMFIDLDRFKTINDSLGHHYGDKLLQGVAERLTACLRAEDTVARLGGDEFVVLLGEISMPPAAGSVAQKLLDALALPMDIEGQQQSVSGSIGISVFPEDGTSLRELMSNADSAMYHAKKVGRGNYQFFAPEMNAAAGARLNLEDLNAKGAMIDGKKVQWVLQAEDDASDPKQGTAVAQKLVDGGVVGVVGHLNSGTTVPASKIYSAAGIPQISPATTSPVYTAQGFKTAFRVVANDKLIGQALARYSLDTLKAKKIAVIDDRTAFGQGLADEFVKGIKATPGGAALIVSRQYTTDKATDFNAILTQIRARKPDVIFYGGMDAVAGPMLKQMKALAIDAKLVSGDGVCSEKLPLLAGDALGNDKVVCVVAGGISADQEAGYNAFVTRYEQRYKLQLQTYAPYAYDAVMTLATAMQQAKSSKPAVFMPVLAKIQYQGVTGNIAFDPKGDLRDAALTLYTYRQGKLTKLKVVR